MLQAADASAGEKVLGYTSDYGARISGAGPNGQSVLRVSTDPLRVQDGEEGKKPVDLTLADQGDAFAPKMPVQPLSIFKQSSGGVSLAGGFSISPVGADVPATLDGNSVFYANVATDTDWVVRPDSMGAETHYVLRSIDSPEQLRLHVGLQPRLSDELCVRPW